MTFSVNPSGIMEYVKRIQEKWLCGAELTTSPELNRYLERGKTADRRRWILDIPSNETPILVFINSRSGGLYGSHLLPQFRRVLHPIQVVDLQEKNPHEALRNFVELENLRILVCGGDISSERWIGA